MTFWPSTLPPDPLFDTIVLRVLAAAADHIDKEWSDMSEKPSGVAAGQAAATDIGFAMQTVEGFPVRTLDYNAKSRFFIVEESISNHCCFGYTVCDRTKPVMIHGVHYKERYETVCECFEFEEAALVCCALNSYLPEASA